MKVLGLVASPRKNGNSEIIVKEMLASLPQDVNKEIIRLTDLEIKPCKACYACLPAEQNCVIKDDLAFFLDKIKGADAVIIASACYFLGSHTSVKTISDRLISILGNAAEYSGKKCVTAVSYGIPGWEGYAREAVNNFARFLHLDVVGNMVVRAANPGEVVEDQTLATAANLASRLLDSASDLSLPGLNTCRQCGSSLLQLSTSGTVRCVMCGAQGAISVNQGKVSAEFPAGGETRFSPQKMIEHCALLESIKQRYISTREELSRRRKPYVQLNDWWVKPPRD